MNSDALHIISVLGGATAGMTSFALAMARHYERLYGHPLPAIAARLLRLAGTACLLAIAWPCAASWGLSIGVVVWTGSVCLAALAVTAVLTWWPHVVPLTGTAAAVFGIAGWLLSR